MKTNNVETAPGAIEPGVSVALWIIGWVVITASAIIFVGSAQELNHRADFGISAGFISFVSGVALIGLGSAVSVLKRIESHLIVGLDFSIVAAVRDPRMSDELERVEVRSSSLPG